MKAYKSIIRNNFIELGEIKDDGLKNVFREYMGFSVEKFENKLGKIDSAIDFSAFKVEETKTNKHKLEGFDYNTLWSTPLRLSGNFTSQKKVDQIISLQNISPEGSIFDDSFTTAVLLGKELEYVDIIHEVETQYDNHFIATLKETYGVEWEIIYEKLLGFKRMFKVLLTLEQLIFDQENKQYQNAEFRLQLHEYFDSFLQSAILLCKKKSSLPKLFEKVL